MSALHPNDIIELESRSVNDTELCDQLAALSQLMEATTTLQSSQEGAKSPAPSTHHCIGLCDPERHGPFDTELDWYYAEGL